MIDMLSRFHFARATTLFFLLSGVVHAEDTAPPRCKYVQVARLPLRYAGPSLDPAIEGSINGTPAIMLVSTGVDRTYLTMTAALRHKLKLGLGNFRLSGTGGTSSVYKTDVTEFSVGALGGGAMQMNVVADSASPPAYDAILGAAFLMQADLEIDLAEKRLRFFRPVDCDHVTFNIWKEDNTVSVPLYDARRDYSDNLHFKATVNGTELDASINTGAKHSYLTASGAARLGIRANSPGMVRLPNVTGFGNEAAAAWSTPVRTVQIGDETIQNGSLDVIYSRGRETEDLVLGQDFLRTHRVLFALAQKKLYLSYRGGSVFTRDAGLPPWVSEEAENGNADAQLVLANRFANGYGVPRDAAQARTWLEKAAAAGQPHANMQLGLQLLRANQVAAAVPKLRAALDLLPSDKYLPLWLYLARVRNGEAELAQQELASSYMASKEEVWPEPVARFYLGKLDADGLLTHARYADNEQQRHVLACMAKDYMGSWYDAHGDKARTASLRDAWNNECKTVADAAGSSRTVPAQQGATGKE